MTRDSLSRWARKHAPRLSPEQVAKLRAGDELVMLACTDEPGSDEWLLCLGLPEISKGPNARGLAILAVLDEETTA